MTKDDFDKLKDGDKVWFSPSYFSIPMLGVARTIRGEKGVWVNFFGDGQCHFVPRGEGFFTTLARYREGER